MTNSSPDTTRLLKARDLRGLGSKVAFNFEDVHRHAAQEMEQARREAGELREAARKEAEAIRREEFEKARQEGRLQGLRDVEDEIQRRAAELAGTWVDDRLRTALPALQSVSESLARERERWLSEWEASAVRISVAIAEKIVRREIQRHSEVPIELVREALRLITSNAQLRIRMCPDDVERIGDFRQQFASVLAGVAELTIIPDAAVSPGGCLLESEHGLIDARIETQLDRIYAELTGRAIGDEG
jgi:flagellar assembly protein FliH